MNHLSQSWTYYFECSNKKQHVKDVEKDTLEEVATWTDAVDDGNERVTVPPARTKVGDLNRADYNDDDDDQIGTQCHVKYLNKYFRLLILIFDLCFLTVKIGLYLVCLGSEL